MTRTHRPLTVRQAEMLSFIRESIASRGLSPTLRELAKSMGCSTANARIHVQTLIRKGCIVRAGAELGRGRSLSRTLRVVVPCGGPARVDLSSAVVGIQPSGVRGVAYRVTAVVGGAT